MIEFERPDAEVLPSRVYGDGWLDRFFGKMAAQSALKRDSELLVMFIVRDTPNFQTVACRFFPIISMVKECIAFSCHPVGYQKPI